MKTATFLAATVITAIAAGIAATASTAIAAILIGAAVLALLASAVPTGIAVSIAIAASLAPRFGYSVSGFKILPEHLAAVFLLLHLTLRRRTGEAIRVALSPAPLAALCLIAWGVIAAHIYAPQPFSSAAIAGWLVLSWVTMVCIAGSGLTREQLTVRLLVIGSAAMTISLFLYVVAVTGVTEWGTAREQLTGAQALRGLWPEQNLLGSSASLLALFAMTRRSTGHRRLTMYLAGSGTLVLLLTFTRAALIGFIVAVALYFVASAGVSRRRAVTAAMTTIAVLIVVTILLPAEIAPIFSKYTPSEAVNFTQGTGLYRANTVTQALADMDHLAWVHGLGTNSFGQRHSAQFNPDQRGYLPVLPLQLVYDYGLIGVILTIYGLLALFRGITASDRRKLFVGFLAFLLASLATSAFWFSSVWIMIAIFLVKRDDGRGQSHSKILTT